MPRKPWKWSTGKRGATVRIFEREPGGSLYVGVPKPGGGYRRVSLGHRDKDRAKRQAIELSAKRLNNNLTAAPITVSELFALYLPTVKGKPSYREQTERAAHAWITFLGPRFSAERIGAREWESFASKRASGEIDACGEPAAEATGRRSVGPNAVAADLRVLRAACKRATMERFPSGDFRLQVDPTRGLEMPTERNPRRPTADHERFERTLAKVHLVQRSEPWNADAGLIVPLTLAVRENGRQNSELPYFRCAGAA